MRAPSGEQGSATVWSLSVGLVLLLTALAVLAWSAALVVRQRAEAAADLAALAGARALLSRLAAVRPGRPGRGRGWGAAGGLSRWRSRR